MFIMLKTKTLRHAAIKLKLKSKVLAHLKCDTAACKSLIKQCYRLMGWMLIIMGFNL